MPSSALRVVNQSPSKLIIVDPPNRTLGIMLGIVGVLISTTAIFLFQYHDARRIGAYLSIAVSLLFVLVAAWTGTGETTVILSRDREMLEILPTSLGSADPATQIPFGKIERANVELLPSTRRLVLLINGGEPVILVTASRRDGYYQAADAINAFLNVSR